MAEPGDDPRLSPGARPGGAGEDIPLLRAPDNDLTVHLVPLRRRHLRSVLRIEAQVYPRPWSLPLFMSELNLRTSRAYIAARVEGVIVGYAGIMLAGEEAHVTTIAVDPAWQRHKVGSRLMARLVRSAMEQGARHLTLEVRMSNLGAQAMYRRFGFEPAGVRKNYYAETKEDALIMWAYDLHSPVATARLAAIEVGIPGGTIDGASPPDPGRLES
ncbi:MAG: ribosomal protein S18-alanine N-acetyltransferase [Actinomycetota bacterium]|nr:ribosomal protein S18-alanine N-acetyltransferase [Actinomycetota bacterium]